MRGVVFNGASPPFSVLPTTTHGREALGNLRGGGSEGDAAGEEGHRRPRRG